LDGPFLHGLYQGHPSIDYPISIGKVISAKGGKEIHAMVRNILSQAKGLLPDSSEN